MRQACLLALVLILATAACESEAPPSAGEFDGITDDESARKFLKGLSDDDREKYKERFGELFKSPEDRALLRDWKDGKITGPELAEEWLSRHPQTGGGSDWSWPSLPHWGVFIPIGLALLVVFCCVLDVFLRLFRSPQDPWHGADGREYKHYVPPTPEPPTDPPPTGEETDGDEPESEGKPDLRRLPDPDEDVEGEDAPDRDLSAA